MNAYFAYGLHIHSPLHLPELLEGGDRSDVDFCLDRVENPDPLSRSPFIRTPSGDIFLAIYQVGRFLIQNGRRVLIDPLPQADERALRIYLLGMVMAILLHQRGKHIFHASAVRLAGQAIAFMGAKGTGKSSTAAYFHAAGCDLITDDILVLSKNTGSMMVSPGNPQFKLMPDAARALQQIPETHEAIHPVLEKHPYRTVHGFVRNPVPLKRVYLLQEAETNEILPLCRKEATREMLPHWYGAQFGLGMIEALGTQRFLSQCALLAQHTPVALLRRRQDLNVFPELLDLATADLERQL